MTALGAKTLYPMERLSVMGFTEVLGDLPRLLALRRNVASHFLKHPPDLFLGIDAPDFNLGLERKLKRGGIKTAHYVSPSVWAWRKYRIKKIFRAVDLMLVLFPFEAEIYRRYAIPVRVVGHPLADETPAHCDKQAARQRLGLRSNAPIIALMPGSRAMELDYLAQPFIDVAQWCYRQNPRIEFVMTFVNESHRARIESILKHGNLELPVHLFVQKSLDVLSASDVVLLASGTAALEAMLVKRPMVMAYRLSWLSYQIIKRMVDLPYYSLPNLLAKKPLVPEFIQDNIDVEQIGRTLLEYLTERQRADILTLEFERLHNELRLDAAYGVTQALLNLQNRALG